MPLRRFGWGWHELLVQIVLNAGCQQLAHLQLLQLLLLQAGLQNCCGRAVALRMRHLFGKVPSASVSITKVLQVLNHLVGICPRNLKDVLVLPRNLSKLLAIQGQKHTVCQRPHRSSVIPRKPQWMLTKIAILGQGQHSRKEWDAGNSARSSLVRLPRRCVLRPLVVEAATGQEKHRFTLAICLEKHIGSGQVHLVHRLEANLVNGCIIRGISLEESVDDQVRQIELLLKFNSEWATEHVQ
mmetsp:Transcript_70773/g.156146  ORF Transcript_70773/g.156146 Transcript_70773/m.156146 type:complete len:241 (+) Transcript_70773:225-947(+)